MLSGIGPASQMQAHRIAVLSDLHGVGNNMNVSVLTKEYIDLPYTSSQDQSFIFTVHQLNITTNSGVLTDPTLHAAAVET